MAINIISVDLLEFFKYLFEIITNSYSSGSRAGRDARKFSSKIANRYFRQVNCRNMS